jgi:UDP-2,3-diacylglucosamine pyrophosphatase LpxH
VKTVVTEDRLLVISDVHMGNPLHRPRQAFMDLIRFALDNDYSICINVDGIDIAQLSIPRLTADITPSLALLVRFAEKGRTIYYTVGNHDIALENFLNDVGRMKVVPFLTVHSGEKRIRIEHGHLYDGMFLRFPRTYFAFTMIGRMAIWISPKVYDRIHDLNLLIIKFAEWMLSGFGLFKAPEDPSLAGRIAGERRCFGDGAEDVGMRGFDAVVLGHTHLKGEVEFRDGLRYYNTGGWFSNPHCIAIHEGRIWFGSVAELIKGGDPLPVTDKDAAAAAAADLSLVPAFAS